MGTCSFSAPSTSSDVYVPCGLWMEVFTPVQSLGLDVSSHCLQVLCLFWALPPSAPTWTDRGKQEEMCCLLSSELTLASLPFFLFSRYPGHIGRTQHAALPESCPRHSSCFQCCTEHNSQSHCIDPLVLQTWTCFFHYFWGCIEPQ